MTEVLEPIQSTIESLHDVATQMDVRAFVVDPETWEKLPGARRDLPEQLFVTGMNSAEEVGLALYIDPDVMAALRSDDPWECLHGGNLQHFCIALEGVSHFVLLTWRGMAGGSVSPLELELQAEVDKFLSAWLLLGEQGAHWEPAGRLLLRWLFGSYALRESVVGDEADRYVVASRAAESFCRQLVERHARRADTEGLKTDARKFYRRGLTDKLRPI